MVDQYPQLRFVKPGPGEEGMAQHLLIDSAQTTPLLSLKH